jgi:hypothetical protein
MKFKLQGTSLFVNMRGTNLLCYFVCNGYIHLYVMAMLTIGYLHNRVFMLVVVGVFG